MASGWILLLLLSGWAEGNDASLPGPVAEEGRISNPVNLEAGCWEGSWLSCKTGHHGKLRATFCRLDDNRVEATFSGSFAKILPFRYRAVLDVVEEVPGKIKLRGSQRLGPVMGTFSYEATIEGDRFEATYQSRRDCGKWTLSQRDCKCR